MNETLTPEQYALLMQLGGENANLSDAIKQQMAQAEQLRTPSLGGMRDAGRAMVAPHWLELLGGLAKNKVAGDISKGADAQQKLMNENTQKQNMMIMQGILRGRQQPMPQPGMGQPDPYDQFRIPGSA